MRTRLKFLRLYAVLACLVSITFSGEVNAACDISRSNGSAADEMGDPLYQLLIDADPCPEDVFEFRALIAGQGGSLHAAMVANQGFNNPADGNFSMFEFVRGPVLESGDPVGAGEFFFGHFTGGDGDTLIANQFPQGLMIELIAWDREKQMFNFYELIGNGNTGEWFYRGDTEDVMRDNELLHLQPDPDDPQFGRRLRCSGCHLSGGPIMKELDAPHNDWWVDDRGIPLDDWEIGERLNEIFGVLVDAGKFAVQVKAGMHRIEKSESVSRLKSELPLPQRLRPLFCTVEVNLQSDGPAFWRGANDISVPAAFFADQRFADDPLIMQRMDYASAMSGFNPAFPGGGIDADHAWVTPVKGYSDQLAIATLLRDGTIDVEFVADVLAVDFTRPMFSDGRCALLRLVPESDDGNWQRQFRNNLEAAAADGDDEILSMASAALLQNISDPLKTARSHRLAVNDYMSACARSLDDTDRRIDLVRYLTQKRQEVAASEISMNDLGQIFEFDGFSGFKRIFPDVSGAPEAFTSKLDSTCVLEDK